MVTGQSMTGQAHGRAGARWARLGYGMLVGITLLANAGGCSPSGITADGDLPPGVQDPTKVQTPAGAMAFYRGVVAAVPQPVERYMTLTGILTDELAALPVPFSTSGYVTPLDSRAEITFPAAGGPGGGNPYGDLHYIRSQAEEARGFLEAYAPDSSPALRAHLLALEGYAELYLADLFCSGIPLSTVDFHGDYTLAAGSTTEEVYAHAAMLFDSALALSSDSVRVQWLAAVGKGRALLGQGQYAAAAVAVAAVPDDYAYQLINGGDRILQDVAENFGSASGVWVPGPPSVGNQEGVTGLSYRSSDDPRTRADLLGNDAAGDSFYFPAKYPTSGAATLTLASGIEARLIEAENALRVGGDDGQWLQILNHLRQTAWPSIVPATTGPLPDLTDPGTVRGREDLLFQERAFWLYLAGYRQGDLRRLIRQYGRPPESVYPTSAYPGGLGVYGSEVVAPVPEAEVQANPNYAGCFHHNA